ncbi:small multidrug resistance transmembrane protein [mine drainage metagenome]|uniref:Small multidrug resistance transmembrane protein n=1 Tax=mine drainage metagenome TaxID=410659 RepID=T1D778_9ZZZZ
MSWVAFLLILTGVLLNAVAQLLLKAAVRGMGQIGLAAPALVRAGWVLAQNPYILGGLACYAASLVVWILALSRVEVSLAYPMLSLGYVVTALGAWAIFSERLAPVQWVGICVIILGVVLLARG